jgi:N-acyl-D-aspartate/D-glutamate deacylase
VATELDWDRGASAGRRADAYIAVFDPNAVEANATWDEIAALVDGFHHTLANGQSILGDGKVLTDRLPGQPTRRTPKGDLR